MSEEDRESSVPAFAGNSDGRAVIGERFPISARVVRRNHFHHVFAHGRRSSHSALRLVLCPNDVGHARLGLAVSRGVSKRAVIRNRLKRRLREIFRRNRDRIPPSLDIVAIPQPAVLELDFEQLRDVFLDLVAAYWSRAEKYGHGDPQSERKGRKPLPRRKRSKR